MMDNDNKHVQCLSALVKELEQMVLHVNREAALVSNACDTYEATIVAKQRRSWIEKRDRRLRERKEQRVMEEQAKALLERAQELASEGAAAVTTKGKADARTKRKPPVPRETVRRAAAASSARRHRVKQQETQQKSSDSDVDVNLTFQIPEKPVDYVKRRSDLLKSCKELSRIRNEFLCLVLPKLANAGFQHDERGNGKTEESKETISIEAEDIGKMVERWFPHGTTVDSFEELMASEMVSQETSKQGMALAARNILDEIFPKWYAANAIRERSAELARKQTLLDEARNLSIVGVPEHFVYTRAARRELTSLCKKSFKARQKISREKLRTQVTRPLKQQLRLLVQKKLFASLLPILEDHSKSGVMTKEFLELYRLIWTSQSAPLCSSRVTFIDNDTL